MKQYKIISVVGTRPQLIKAACITNEINKHNIINETIIHTGQHYDKSMSDFFFVNFKKKLKLINLNINNLNHSEMIARMIIKLSKIFKKIKPNLVLLYGDTNSTLAGALTASKHKMSIAHIEGGLRNYDLTIPEDVNRIITDRISNLIFYSTEVAKRNLLSEGFGKFPCKLVKTDDLMSDSVYGNISYVRKKSTILDQLKLNNVKEKFILLTIHRDKSLNVKNLANIFNAINKIAKKKI
jgi:UDP-GlcNAc3NAcA epimerase